MIEAAKKDRQIISDDWHLLKEAIEGVQLKEVLHVPAVSLSRGLLIRVISDGNDPKLNCRPLIAPPGTETVRLEFRLRLDADVRTVIGLLGTYFRS